MVNDSEASEMEQVENLNRLRQQADLLEVKARISEARLREHKARTEFRHLVRTERAAKVLGERSED